MQRIFNILHASIGREADLGMMSMVLRRTVPASSPSSQSVRRGPCAARFSLEIVIGIK
jgi:hypothetical protein